METLVILLGSIAIIAIVLIVAIYKTAEYLIIKEILKHGYYFEDEDDIE